METLKAKVRMMTTEQILEAVMILGGGRLSIDKNMVRAALIGIYIERTSEAEGDLLMDAIGM